MKARIKHTQQIIDVEWNLRGWIWDSPNGKRLFVEEELDFFDSDNIDWQSFRAEAAKDILCAMISNEGVADESNVDDFTKDNQVKDAVLYADKLISKLKEKEEK